MVLLTTIMAVYGTTITMVFIIIHSGMTDTGISDHIVRFTLGIGITIIVSIQVTEIMVIGSVLVITDLIDLTVDTVADHMRDIDHLAHIMVVDTDMEMDTTHPQAVITMVMVVAIIPVVDNQVVDM